MTKIMVVGGFASEATDDVEIIDLSTNSSVCANIWPFPEEFERGVGGLFNRNTPVVCSPR